MKKTIIIILAILFFGFILYYMNRYNELQYFKPVTLTDDNSIVNVTDKPYMDTVVSVGLDFLGVKDNLITIREMPDEVKSSFNSQNDLDLTASIIGRDGQYVIYIDNVDRATAIKSLAHELIHLEQYSTEKLKVIGSGVVLWDDKQIYVLEVPYNDRPWEIDAFKRQYELEKKIIEKLY